MSVRFDASADNYVATTGLPGTTFTVTLWGRIAVDRNQYSSFVGVDNTTENQVLSIQTDTDGVSPYLWLAPHGTNFVSVSPSLSMTVGSWYRMALVRSGTSVTWYLATATGAVSSGAGTLTGTLSQTRFRLGHSPKSVEWLNGNIANVKVYNAALTQAEIVTEWGNWQAQRTADLLRHHKFQSAAETVDYSGNGWSLTSAGTPTFEATNPSIADSPPAGADPLLWRLGSTAVSSLRVGTTAVSGLYLGSAQLWPGAPDPPPTGGSPTGGSGGPLTDRTSVSYSNGTKSSAYHIYASGLDWTKRVGLLVYGDGSGEQGLADPSSTYLMAGTSGLIAVAKSHNMVLVTPRAPGNGCTDGDGVCWYLGSNDGTTRAQKTKWLDDLIKTQVLPLYNIDKTRVCIGGFSSGAENAAGIYGPAYAASWMEDGLLLAISYGSSPDQYGVTDTYTTAFRANVAVVWDVRGGDETTAVADSLEGYNWYVAEGFATLERNIIAGGAHDRPGEFGGIVDQYVSEYVIATG